MRKKGNTYDYSFVDAVFSIKINKYLFLTAGNGKLFVGQGYRSLILSDNAYGYPYLRLAFLAEKWQYTVTRCSLFDFGKKNLLSADFFQAFDRKSLAYHSLGFSPFKSINLSVFEAYIVSAGNTGWEFANPIIYVGSVNTSNKFALRGFSFNATISKQLLFYSQVVNSSNTLQAKNTAWQVGMQWYALGNLYFRTEYNEAGKNVYSNPDRLLQYTHYNQPLANAFGNGFNETVLVANANVKRWNLNYRLSFVKFAANYKPLIYYRYENFDKDWFTTQYTNAKSLQKHDVCLSYLINRAMNFKAEIGYSHRLFGNALFTSPGQYVYFTLKTSLGNMYDDY
jgi:hypothetical protein